MKFKLAQVTKIQDIIDKKVTVIPESDVLFQTQEYVIQFAEDKQEDDDVNKIIINPGCFSFVNLPMAGLALSKFELRDYNLLLNIDNTKLISEEMVKFFNKVDLYKKLNRTPKRSVLLCSLPGVGKTSTISRVAKDFLEKDEGTCVIIWDTSEFNAPSINNFFLKKSTFSEKVTKLILIIEDIEGGSHDSSSSGRFSSSSSLLNFLDGVGEPFKGIPAFTIATTNNPEKSVGALIDRPGRFDKVLELKTPNAKEAQELLKYIGKIEDLDEDQITACELAASNEFSIAHIQEIVIRSLIDDKSILEVTKELVNHKKRFKNAFINSPIRKIGLSDDWDD